jgi:hypothetical protein
MFCYVKVCNIVRGILTFLYVPILFASTALVAFYMSSSSHYFVKLRETVLGLLLGILEKKNDVKPLPKH